MDKIFTSLPQDKKAYWETTLKPKIEKRVAKNTVVPLNIVQVKEWKGYRFLPRFEPETAKRAYEEMEIEEGTVFVASFPRTGTNWIMEITKQLLFGHDETLMAVCNALTSDLYYIETQEPEKLDLLKYIALPRKVFGTHLPEELVNVDKIKKSKGKIIVLVRNPKDQAVSWYHFTKNNRNLRIIGDEFSPDWNQFFVDYMSGKHPIMTKRGECYPDHLAGWYKHKDDASVLFVYYEDTRKNPAKEVKRIAEFLDIKLAESRVSEIVNATSFEAMRNDQESETSVLAMLRSRVGAVRRGQVGAWKDTFTVAQSEQMDRILKKKLAGCEDLKFTYE